MEKMTRDEANKFAQDLRKEDAEGGRLPAGGAEEEIAMELAAGGGPVLDEIEQEKADGGGPIVDELTREGIAI